MEILIGIAAGALITTIVFLALTRDKKDGTADFEQLSGQFKDTFSAMSMEAFSKSIDEFRKAASETLALQTQAGEKDLEGKKGLIDQQLEAMNKELEKVAGTIKEFDKGTENKFGQLSMQIKNSVEQTNKLQETTAQLRSALSNTTTRGQWGERMAEDVLRTAGFIEGINYDKQKSLDSNQGKPDFTFYLPQNLKVNMDVKFPLDNYLNYLNADNALEKDAFKTKFLKDVKQRVKEVTTRDYINPEDKTVDYMLVFIPNEQIYGFINENDMSLLDEALRNKVVLCSPITLYAILAVIRQAIDNFKMEQAADKILNLLAQFQSQWGKFTDSMEKVGRRINDAQKEYNNLSTTRLNQLERPLRQIEDIRNERSIHAPVIEDNAQIISIDPPAEEIRDL